jgi:hypothetical protein
VSLGSYSPVIRPEMQKVTTAWSTQQQPFTIYMDRTAGQLFDEDYEARMSTSPSPYDADNGLSSDENESVLPSIESHPDARKSSAAFTSISSIPPSLPYDSGISPYTPRKGARAAFRSPSNVRAIQMSSPQPFQSSRHKRIESPLSARRAARDDTSSSIRSGSVLHNIRHIQKYDEQSATSQGSEDGRNTPSMQRQPPPTRGPLVLLHVTVLPCPGLPYSIDSLQELAPSYVLHNWHMLQEKLTETVLSRGVLIPHPGEEFDMLEEGLLETLGLRAPRISSCGHFYGDGLESDSDSDHDSGVSDVGGQRKQLKLLGDKLHKSTHSEMEDTCHECEQTIRVPGKGISSGNARWEIKIYASNGLMRAGAWFAAWREMERVDVEIEPWIPEDVRRALDRKMGQEQDKLRSEHEELDRLRFDLEVMDQLRTEADDQRSKIEQRMKDMEQELELARTRTPPVQHAIAMPPSEDELFVPRKRDSSITPAKQTTSLASPALVPQEIPLSTLLRNYFMLLAQDRRNIALGMLSVLVILLSLRLGSSPKATATEPLNTMHSQLGNDILSDILPQMASYRHLSVDTGSLTRSSTRSPTVEAMSARYEQKHDNKPILPTSSEFVEDAPIESLFQRPEGGAVLASHPSVLQESEATSSAIGVNLSAKSSPKELRSN